MAHTFRNAFAGGDSTEIVRRKSEDDRKITKLANAESTRQKMLKSRKWLGKPLSPEEVYTGADLKKPR